MPANTAPIFTSVPHSEGTQFTSTDTTTKKTCFTPGTNGSRIDGIMVSTNDTTAVVLNFYVSFGGTDYYLGDVTVPIGSGYTTVARTNALIVIAPPATGALVLESGHLLKVACNATMTAAKTTDIVVVGGDF